MIRPEDEKLIMKRRAATRGSVGLSIFAIAVLLGLWGGAFWMFPEYLNPMHVFDGIQDGTLSRDKVNFFAGITIILIHIVCLLLVVIVLCSTRGLRRESRLLQVIDRMRESFVSATGRSGETGSWKLE